MTAEARTAVVVIGNIGIDTNVFLQGDMIDLVHESNYTCNLDTIGQAGGYASMGYARLGVPTAFIGYVGADPMGDFIRDALASEKIDTSALFVDPQGTSRSINLVLADGSRRNFYDGKSHMELEPPLQPCLNRLRNARLAHFNIPNWARRLLAPAQELGVTIACDLQDVMDLADLYRMDFVRAADYLFFSAVNHPHPASHIHAYLDLNPGLTILATMGARGVALADASGITNFAALELDLPLVDTSGAGDAFASGFLVSRVLEGRELEASVMRGQICARYKCAQRSTSANMITPELLDHYLQILTGPTL